MKTKYKTNIMSREGLRESRVARRHARRAVLFLIWSERNEFREFFGMGDGWMGVATHDPSRPTLRK